MSAPVVIGRVVSVNTGQPRTVDWHGRQVTTSIWKVPVPGVVAVKGVNMDGDQQADLRVHGGYDKAVYAYAIEDYRWWTKQLNGPPLAPGTFGENLTTEGIDLTAATIGERWLVGSATLEVSEPRFPCFKLGIRMGDSAFVDRFDEAGRFGTYLRIVAEGEVNASSEIALSSRPVGLTIGDLIQVDREPTPELLDRIASSPQVPERWRAKADRALDRQRAR